MEVYLNDRHLFHRWKYTAPLRNPSASGCCNGAHVARQRVIHYFGDTEMRDSNPSIKLCGHSMRWRFNGYCSWCWNIWSNKLLFVVDVMLMQGWRLCNCSQFTANTLALQWYMHNLLESGGGKSNQTPKPFNQSNIVRFKVKLSEVAK